MSASGSGLAWASIAVITRAAQADLTLDPSGVVLEGDAAVLCQEAEFCDTCAHVGDGLYRVGGLPGANPAGCHGRRQHPAAGHRAVSRAGGLGMLEHASLIPCGAFWSQLLDAVLGSDPAGGRSPTLP